MSSIGIVMIIMMFNVDIVKCFEKIFHEFLLNKIPICALARVMMKIRPKKGGAKKKPKASTFDEKA